MTTKNLRVLLEGGEVLECMLQDGYSTVTKCGLVDIQKKTTPSKSTLIPELKSPTEE